MVFCFQNYSDLLLKYSSNQEKLLKLEAKIEFPREFPKNLLSLEKYNFERECFFYFVPGGFLDLMNYNNQNSNWKNN